MSEGGGDRRVVALAFALFFLSGVAGLVYQVVWARFLNEIFGVTVYAVTAVLVTFLGGLALGGFVLGSLADRVARPLVLFGALEIGVALTALAGLVTLSLLDPLELAAARRFAPDSPVLLLARVGLASSVILPPTFLMGGTLPALTRGFTTSIGRAGRSLSALYAVNTFGAVAGTLAAGFVLVRSLGLTPTLWVAAGINLLVGASALAIGRGWVARAREVEPSSPGVRGPGSGLLVVMALSGFASLGLEVLWTRALVVPLGTSAYAYVTMLAAFLVGIALGGILARAVADPSRDLRRLIGWLQVGIGASALATLPVLSQVGGGAGARHLEGADVSWVTFVALRFGISFLVMLVPSTLIGMTFPVAGALWARESRTLGRRIGQIYGVNTLGNILGAAATGFWLLPAIGIQKGVAVLVALNLVAATWGFLPALVPARPSRKGAARVWRAGEAGLVTTGMAVCALVLLRWDPAPSRVHGEGPRDRTLYYREGIVGTVKVIEEAENSNHRLMAIDGVKIGESTGGVDAKQQALAHFPFLILSDRVVRRVLTIGLGTGILAGEAAAHPGVESVVCLEISPSVIEASRWFDEWNHDVRRNPRVRIVNDDGVGYLRRDASRYDVIISDAKSRAGHAANALFFSTDYYRLCRDHLESGGLMIQWVPLVVPPQELRMIVRSFGAVFDELYLWLGNDSCLMAGRDRPIVLDVPHIERILAQPTTRRLHRYGWGDAYTFASMLLCDRGSLAAVLARERTVNTLERPVLEFYSLTEFAEQPRARRSANLLELLSASRAPFDRVSWVGADSSRVGIAHRAALRVVEGVARFERGEEEAVRGLALVLGAAEEAPTHAMARQEAGRASFEAALASQRRGALEEAVDLYRRAVRYRPEHALTFYNLGGALAGRGDLETALVALGRAAELDPGFAPAHESLARVLLGVGRLPEAAAAFRRAIDIDPARAGAHAGLAESLAALGDKSGARRHAREAARLGAR